MSLSSDTAREVKAVHVGRGGAFYRRRRELAQQANEKDNGSWIYMKRLLLANQLGCLNFRFSELLQAHCFLRQFQRSF